MTKETFVFVAGLALTLIPFIGVPLEWRQYTIFGIGIILLVIGYILRRDRFLNQIDRGDGERATDSFVETTEKLFDDSSVK